MNHVTRSSTASTRTLHETGFLMIAGCQVNPLVLLIRDDGPAMLGSIALQLDAGTGATAPVEPRA